MTDNTQTICITCGMQSAKLYTRYKGDIIKIAHCVSKPTDRFDLNSLSTQVRTPQMLSDWFSPLYWLREHPRFDDFNFPLYKPIYFNPGVCCAPGDLRHPKCAQFGGISSDYAHHGSALSALYLNLGDYLVRNNRASRHIHSLAYRQIHSQRLLQVHNSPRTIIHWNALPANIPTLPTLAQFSSAVCRVIHVSP